MTDSTLKPRGYRAIPRQGMRKWSVVHDVDGRTVVVAEFHSYPAAIAESKRLNADAADKSSTSSKSHADNRVEVLA